MTSPFKRVLLVGATSGIGASMADKLVKEGAHVIAVGRRKDRLDAFVAKHGASTASSIAYDITDHAGAEEFVSRVIESYPDLDCVFLNAGFQRPYNLADPCNVDLASFHREMSTNFTAIVNLCIKFLPHLLQRDNSSLIITGSLVSLVPVVSCSAYSASKAALHAFFECLRRQNQGSSVNFIEVSPPLVQSELHDYMGPKGRTLGMPVDEFVAQAYAGILKRDEWIDVGVPGTPFEGDYRSIINAQRSIFRSMSDVIMASK